MDKQPIYTLTLKRIYCHLADEQDADEIFLKYKGEKIWPKNEKYVSMKESDEALNIEIKIPKGDKAEIEIWDYDRWSSNDHLGTVSILADHSGDSFRTDMIKKETKHSHYSIDWEVY